MAPAPSTSLLFREANVAEQLYWHCLQCGDHEEVKPTGGSHEYVLGDKEKCIACGEGMAHVVTLKQGACYEQGRALGLSVDSAWRRALRFGATP